MSRILDLWKNLPFARKIGILPALACLGFGVFLWVSWTTGQESEELLTEVERGHYASLELGYLIDAELSQLQRLFQDAAATADTTLLADAESVRSSVIDAIAEVRLTSPLDTTELQEFAPQLNAYVELAQSTSRDFIGGETGGNFFDDLQRVNDMFAALETQVSAMIDRDRSAVRHGLSEIVGAQSSSTQTFIILVSVLALVLVALSWVIISSTTSAIRSTAIRMEALAHGDFAAAKDGDSHSRDEIGTMLENVSIVTSTIEELLGEVRELGVQVRAGKLQHRGKSAEFDGAFAELIENVNELIEEMVRPIEATSGYVEQIAQGRIPPEITDKYEGDFNTIKQNINVLVGTMNGLIAQTGKLTTAAKAGELEVSGDADQFSGVWRDLIAGINETLNAVTTPVHEISVFMSEMARGNLDWRVGEEHKGLFNQLSKDANSTGQTLADVIGTIRTAATTIQHGVEEVSNGNNNLSARTEAQAANLEETAANIEELTAVVQSNAERTTEASSAAESARSLAQEGEDVVNQAVKAMNELNDSSRSIVEIINVIDTIAFQTNLLALNAAVEAARAGEQGRGFAVVASEVRQLAGRSAKAAREIKELINDSTSKIDEGARLVGTSGSTLQEIIQSVKRVADLVAEISEAGQDQQRGIEEVNTVVGDLDRMTQQNAALVVEVASTGTSIGVQASDLMHLLEFFEVGDKRSGSAQQFAPEDSDADMPYDDEEQMAANL